MTDENALLFELMEDHDGFGRLASDSLGALPNVYHPAFATGPGLSATTADAPEGLFRFDDNNNPHLENTFLLPFSDHVLPTNSHEIDSLNWPGDVVANQKEIEELLSFPKEVATDVASPDVTTEPKDLAAKS